MTSIGSFTTPPTATIPSLANTTSTRVPTARSNDIPNTARTNMNNPNSTSGNNPTDYELSSIDSLRFMAILEEGKERLELIGALLSDSSKRREAIDATTVHREEIVNLLIHQRNLEKQFDVLMKRRNELQGLNNRTKYLENEKAIQNMLHQLQQSQTNLSNQLSDEPSRLSSLQKLQKDHQTLTNAINSTREDLEKNNSFAVLLNLISARMEEEDILEESRRTEAKNVWAIERLENDILQEQASFQANYNEKTRLIEKLTSELKHLRQISSSQLSYRNETTQSYLEAQRRITAYQREDHEKKITSLTRDINDNEKCFERATVFHNNHRQLLDKVHETWQNKLKTDLASRDAIIQQLRDLRISQKEKLSSLTEAWEKVVQEKTEQVNLLKKRTIEHDAKEELAKKMDWAQRCIRYHWFAYKQRKEAKRIEAKRKRLRELRAQRKAEKNKKRF